MIKREPIHFVGLDHSGPCKVLPPTFHGVKELVNQVGESMAKAMYSKSDDFEEDESKDLVRDFLQDLTYADKVERQTLIREFSDFVSDLNEKGHELPKEEPPKEEPPKEEPPKEEPPKE